MRRSPNSVTLVLRWPLLGETLPRRRNPIVPGPTLTCWTSYFINYVTETRSDTDSALGAKFLAGAQASFALGRFAGTAIMRFVRPRKVFGVYLTMCIIFIAPAITQRENIGMSMLYITLFFESICFPTIVALGMRGLGRHT